MSPLDAMMVYLDECSASALDRLMSRMSTMSMSSPTPASGQMTLSKRTSPTSTGLRWSNYFLPVESSRRMGSTMLASLCRSSTTIHPSHFSLILCSQAMHAMKSEASTVSITWDRNYSVHPTGKTSSSLTLQKTRAMVRYREIYSISIMLSMFTRPGSSRIILPTSWNDEDLRAFWSGLLAQYPPCLRSWNVTEWG